MHRPDAKTSHFSPALFLFFLLPSEFADGSVVKEGTLFRTVVTNALQRLHGQVGAAIAVDVLQIDATGAAILRVSNGVTVCSFGLLCVCV